MSTITIPCVLIEAIREGAYAVSRDVAEAIDHGEDLRVCRERLDGVCRLLEAVGSTRADPSTDTDVDLDVHAATLRPLAAIMLPLLRDAPGERDVYEALRALAAELPDVPGSLAIPADVVVPLRSALYADLGTAAEHLAGECSLEAPEDVLGRLARLDRVRGLLDVVGWSAPEHQQPLVLDFGVYGQTVRDVLQGDLEIERDFTDTDDPAQRERASNEVALIERFLAELDASR
jgi:hypothetical protein